MENNSKATKALTYLVVAAAILASFYAGRVFEKETQLNLLYHAVSLAEDSANPRSVNLNS